MTILLALLQFAQTLLAYLNGRSRQQVTNEKLRSSQLGEAHAKLLRALKARRKARAEFQSEGDGETHDDNKA